MIALDIFNTFLTNFNSWTSFNCQKILLQQNTAAIRIHSIELIEQNQGHFSLASKRFTFKI